MKRLLPFILSMGLFLASCTPVNLDAPMPSFTTGVDPQAWASVPAGEFLKGQFEEKAATDAFQIMVTDVTTAQYAAFLNEALAAGRVKLEGDRISGYYPGDIFRGVKHEERVDEGYKVYIPLDDPSLRLQKTGDKYSAQPGYEDHPMTMVSWFGARGYCEFYGYRLPTETEWEKAARGTDGRPYPWGDDILRENANFYASRDPYEDMTSYGSRTTPVGFYNGRTYGDYTTLDSPSPYGLYDMAGNVWQWTDDVYEGMHYRFMRGGSKDTYDYELRTWSSNNATPTYYSPGVGFRCARTAE